MSDEKTVEERLATLEGATLWLGTQIATLANDLKRAVEVLSNHRAGLDATREGLAASVETIGQILTDISAGSITADGMVARLEALAQALNEHYLAAVPVDVADSFGSGERENYP